MSAIPRPLGRPANSDALSAVLRMEIPLSRAEGFARTIQHLGAGPNEIEPAVLHTIGTAMLEAVRTLKAEWDQAHEALAHGGVR